VAGDRPVEPQHDNVGLLISHASLAELPTDQTIAAPHH
jgi:hypothetical protein